MTETPPPPKQFDSKVLGPFQFLAPVGLLGFSVAYFATGSRVFVIFLVAWLVVLIALFVIKNRRR